MTYYKATRTDGTSFYDSKTAWKVGRITWLKGERGDDPCGPGILQAATEPGESLVGGSWPCRLFEVEPRTIYLRTRHTRTRWAPTRGR